MVNYLASFAPSSSVGHTHPVPQPDSYPGYAASILAGNNFFRAIVGGAFPLFARAMFENLQKKNGPAAFPVSWGCTLCEYSSCFQSLTRAESSSVGCLSLVMVPLPYIFFKYGRRIRHMSKYALHDD